MLGREYGSRNQHGNLTPVHNCLERGSNRNLSFAETDIAADQPVHDSGALHVAFDILDRMNLILCLLIGKHLLKFRLPNRIFIKAVTAAFPAFSV